ncbi:MAG: hypothetical protein MJZ37_08465 [Bacilli bacterium]|nr:hypothetical protein [Bacilli bacterium]
MRNIREQKVLESIAAEFDSKFCRNIGRTGLYGKIIELIGCEQFTWNGLPNNFLSHYAERYVNSGLAVAYEIPEGISAVNQGFTITPCSFIGVKDNQELTNKVITKGSDYSIELDLDTDKAVLIKNNDFMYTEYENLMWFAMMLSKTDESEERLITWSKMHPIPRATTGVKAAQLEEILNDIMNGESKCSVISDNTKVVTNQPLSRDDSVLRLTDENAVEKMHFLSEFHYELIRRYCNLYNMPFRTTAKSAQNLESELHNTDIFSQFINENRLKCRKEAAEKISEMFNCNCTVDFSELIKKENSIIDANIEHEKMGMLSQNEG